MAMDVMNDSQNSNTNNNRTVRPANSSMANNLHRANRDVAAWRVSKENPLWETVTLDTSPYNGPSKLDMLA